MNLLPILLGLGFPALLSCAKHTDGAVDACSGGSTSADAGTTLTGSYLGPADDALVWQGRAPGSTFIEITDVLAVDQRAWMCTGVGGLQVFNVDAPGAISLVAEVDLAQASDRYPRCQYLAWQGDRVLVAAHVDEIQPEAWLAYVDVSDPDAPKVLDTLTSGRNTEGATFFGDASIESRVVLAAHDDGLVVLSVATGRLVEEQVVDLGVNVHRVDPVGDYLAVGTVAGELLVLDADLTEVGRLDLGIAVQDVLDLGDGRAAVALGSGGVALISLAADGSPVLLGTTSVAGSATKLALLGDGHLAVAGWTDLRVFDVSGESPVLAAVEGVFEASDDPRVLAVGAVGDVVMAGEWTGLHAYQWYADRPGPELSVDRRVVKVAADGTDQTAVLYVENEGQEALIVDDISTPEGWTVSEPTLSLDPGESVPLWLQRTGTTTLDSASLTLCSNDPDEPSSTVTLQTGSNGLTVGDVAPDFLYPGLNTGQSHGLAEQLGHVVLLSYFATF